MLAFEPDHRGARIAFTDRHGGVSDGAWSSLNLGTSNGDDPDRVRTNLGLLAEACGAEDGLHRMSQLHGDDVQVVRAGDDPDIVPHADALVTADPGVALLVRVADCTPVALASDDGAVVGVVHAGRRGLVNDVSLRAVERMRELGASSLTAWLGPRACGRCYEVPAEMRAEVAAAVPAAWSETSWGTPALDVGAGLVERLTGAGVTVVDLAEQGSTCTIEDDHYFSYRRQGQRSGRLGAVVRRLP